MALGSRIMNGIRAGWAAFVKDPEAQLRDLTHEERVNLYGEGWAYYTNKMFSTRDGLNWEGYLTMRELYKHTRLIYNPVVPIVDFYVDNIWQKADRDDFELLVTDVEEDVDEPLVDAISQLDQWGNWLSESMKAKRYAAATGEVLIEGVDDLDRQKVYHKICWPGFVRDIELNATGDVVGYVVEYDVFDRSAGKTFVYRKEVTKDEYRYFKDDKAWVPPGKTAAVEPNLYGFVFAVWIRHRDDGGDHGAPAVNNLDKVDNINSLASHIDDFIHRDIESPKIIGASGEIVPIIGGYKDKTGVVHPQDPRLNWVVLKADTTKGSVAVHDLSGVLKLGEASPELERQLKSFEQDYPELQAATIMKENAQLSGAALERMLGPAQNRLDGVQPGYNQQLIKLRQMQVAIGGMRANGGGWTNMTDQQKRFKPFNLNSYGQGKLDFGIKRAQLVHESEGEIEDTKMKKANRADVLLNIGVDELEALQVAGYTEEQAQEIIDRKAEDQSNITDTSILASNLLPPVPGQQNPPNQLPRGRQPAQIGVGNGNQN